MSGPQFPGMLDQFMDETAGEDRIAQLYSFSDRVSPQKAADSLGFNRTGTNISGSLEEVSKLYKNQNLRAVVLISDGISTSGANPLYLLDGFEQPVFTVLLGDTTEQKDVKIAEVLFNEIAYLENETPVKVKVHSAGYDNRRVKVVLQQKNKVIGEEEISISKEQPQPRCGLSDQT